MQEEESFRSEYEELDAVLELLSTSFADGRKKRRKSSYAADNDDVYIKKRYKKLSSDLGKIKRTQLPKLQPSIPRLLVFDIRKCYNKMLQNVLNSGDFALLYGFLDLFCGPSIRHTTVK